MAKFTTETANFDLSTDANARTFWSMVDAQIQGLGGWTYVPQVGDGDPATMATGAAGTFPIFRVYKTTVAGKDWFVRLDYGHDANGPQFKHKFGSAVDGSGTLSGQVSTQVTLAQASGTAGGATRQVIIAAATGRLMIFIGAGTTNSTWGGMSVHARVDSTGVMLDTGLDIFTYADNVNVTSSQALPATGTVPAKKSYIPCNYGVENTQKIGAVATHGHPFLWDADGGNNPTLAVVLLPALDYAINFITTIDMYGEPRDYMVGQSFNTMSGSASAITVGMLAD